MVEKRRKVTMVVAVVMVAILGMMLFIKPNTDKAQMVASSELAKAMTYEQVEEGDKAVEGTENVQFDAFFLRDINNDGYAEDQCPNRGVLKRCQN